VGNTVETNELLVYGRVNPPTKNLEIAQSVNGELIVSTRALTRAFRLSPSHVSGANPSRLRTTVSDLTGGYVSRVAELFCFWRGGLAYKLYPPNLDEFTLPGNYVHTELQPLFPHDNLARSLDPMSHRTYTALNPFHEINVPFYSTTRRAITNDGQAEGTANAARFRPCVRIFTSHDTLDYLVAGKDDLNMGFLYGCGPQITHQEL
jgi:hypothetical protein